MIRLEIVLKERNMFHIMVLGMIIFSYNDLER